MSLWRIGPTRLFCYIPEDKKVCGSYTIKPQRWNYHSKPHYSSLYLAQLYTSAVKEDRWRSFGSCKPRCLECRTVFLNWFTPCSPVLRRLKCMEPWLKRHLVGFSIMVYAAWQLLPLLNGKGQQVWPSVLSSKKQNQTKPQGEINDLGQQIPLGKQ